MKEIETPSDNRFVEMAAGIGNLNDNGILPLNTAGNMSGSPSIISLSDGIRFNKISKITDSFGQQLTVSYKDQKNPYAASQKMIDYIKIPDEQTVINNSLPQLEVVNSITAPNTNQSYEYAYPQFLRQDSLDRRLQSLNEYGI